ncbi:MAG: Zn-ribbon domain-containing OB-fold protein [Anaerolineae bacterium]|nr:Zn-ribbon domain-containing OB-fold protein [Anaerolineae bacterium]
MEYKVAHDWRLRGQRYRLEGEICDHCGVKIFPPRDICPECNQPAKRPYTLSGRGEVYSFSTVFSAPEGFETYAPYTVAIIKLIEGPMVTAQLTDVAPNEVEIGMPVEMVTRRIRTQGEDGTIAYGYKFRPVYPSAQQ